MKISLRLETKDDYFEVENMTRKAFWDLYRPGCVEHYIVNKIRSSDDFIRELDYVACFEDEIVGNIVYSKAKVISETNHKNEVLCMGPLAVLPKFQRKGIGSILMNHTIQIAKLLRYKGIVIFGNPKFYSKFGFKDASEYNIQTAQGENFETFMVLELFEESLKDINGKFYPDSVFEVDTEDIEGFDAEYELYELNHKGA